MHWYEGGISDAVTLTKQKGAIFVVYIEGDDGKSKHITDLINSDEITKLLESEHFVAIKLEGNSVPHQQFNEIYKDTAVPSIYFIGKNGTPLDIIRDVEDKEKLAQKVGSILQKAGISIAARSEDLIKSEQGSSSPSPPDGVVCENGVCTIKKQKPSPDKSEATPPVGDSSPILTEEEKLNRAKDVLKKQRELKQKEEEEKERQQEIERRKMGQSVQNLKRWQQDEELKQLKEEREKEKRLNQEARDRVLAQIAQDKAERASKFSPPSQSQPEKPKEGSPATAQPSTSSGKQQSNEARLQFKLPDGSSHTHEFPSADSLQSVVDYIKMNLNLSFNNFTLSTTFPRREFTTNDYSQSLRDLLLVPNAVILVLPIGGHGAVTTNPGGSGLGNFIWYLVAPLWGIFQYLKGLVFGEGSGAASSGVKREAGSSYSASSRNTVLNVSSKYDLENKLKNARSKLVVIDFFATWCGPCRMIAPKLEELAREFPNVVFLKVDVDDNRDISSSYGVRAMPTFVFVKNSKNVTSFSGADYYKIRDTILRFK